MAADHDEFVVYRPMGHRDAGEGGNSDRAGDAGHHCYRDPSLGECEYFLKSAGEDEGITAF